MALATADPDALLDALHDLREARRRRRMGEWNVIDALYRAYLAAIATGVAILVLSGLVGDQPLHGHALTDVARAGPAAVGLAVALAFAVGLRSGAHGGPISLEPAEVRHVLLAPVDRSAALQAPARRQLRFGSFVGVVAGAVVGVLAWRRLPGTPGYWIGCGAIVGLLTGVGFMAVALVASGRRLHRWPATLLGAGFLAWTGFDLAARTTTSPATWVGAIAIWPLRFRVVGFGGFVVPVLVAAAGLAGVGGLSLEAAERRGRLVDQLRFAATFQDLRTVLLLRRQLANEQPRSRQWFRMRVGRGRFPIWRRDWYGISRWPAVRFGRLAALGAIAGLATAGAWAGTSPLIVLAGMALFVAALDATEGLAQELDHPDRRDSFPMHADAIHLRHLAAPSVTMIGVALVGVIAAAAIDPRRAILIGAPLAIPAGLGAVAGAAVAALRNPPDPRQIVADVTGIATVYRQAFPPAIASIAPALVLAVKAETERQGTALIVAAGAFALLGLVVPVLAFGWVRVREQIALAIGGPRT